MPRPKAYEPQSGYKFQILCRNQQQDRAWEHCDYAVDAADKRLLLDNYRTAYGAGWEFNTILLPAKYWPTFVESRRRHRQERMARGELPPMNRVT